MKLRRFVSDPKTTRTERPSYAAKPMGEQIEHRHWYQRMGPEVHVKMDPPTCSGRPARAAMALPSPVQVCAEVAEKYARP